MPGFIFDVIIVRIDAPNNTFEDPTKVTVDCLFLKTVPLKITSSRINVVDFRSGRSYEFTTDIEDLKAALAANPLKLTVNYDNKLVGAGEMPWPDRFYSRICNRMGELTHVDECGIYKMMPKVVTPAVVPGAAPGAVGAKPAVPAAVPVTAAASAASKVGVAPAAAGAPVMENVKVGNVEIIVRLQIKCTEIDDPSLRTPDDIRRNLGKVINPHDILFIVGKSEHDSCMALAPAGGEGGEQHATALDLSRYRQMNGRLVQTPDAVNTCVNMDCCELKKISNEYQRIIDALSGCAQPRSCGASSHVRDCPHSQEQRFSESCSQESSAMLDQKLPCSCFAAEHNRSDGAFYGEKLVNICPQEEPKLMQTHFNTPRNCPVCKENLSWLPKLACCPKCGYKPVPIVEEKPYDLQLTADQILQEYLNKRSSETTTASVDINDNNETCELKDKKKYLEKEKQEKQQKECKCTCKEGGKTCAHCRIRKLCEDIFQTKSRNSLENVSDDCGKCEPKESDAYNICRSSSKDCRPYLARVFSELRDLYDIKDPKQKTFDFDPRCEKELQMDIRNKHRLSNAEKGDANQAPTRTSQDKTPQPERQKSGQTTDFGNQKVKTVVQERVKRKKKKQPLGQTFDKNAKAKAKTHDKDGCKKPKIYDYRSIRAAGATAGATCQLNAMPGGRKNVPRNMGWLWNIDTKGARRGWKPGAIRKPIKEIMKYFLKDFPADTLVVSPYSYRKTKDNGPGGGDEEEELVQRPTLHICKKNDEYFITLRPLKDPDALKHCADPYLKMKPIQFKITKNPLMTEVRKLKRCLKEMGFSKCTCHKPVVDCFCRSFLDKKRLEYQLSKECRKRNMPCCSDSLVLSDTTDSDVEFDFGVTPPAGVVKPDRLRKPNLVNHGTQYVQGDWNVQPVFAKPPNKFMKLYNCAIGDRYDTSWLGEGGWDEWGGGGGWGGGGPGGGGGWGPGGGGPGGRGGWGPGGGGGPGGRGGWGPGGGGGPGGRGGWGPGGGRGGGPGGRGGGPGGRGGGPGGGWGGGGPGGRGGGPGGRGGGPGVRGGKDRERGGLGGGGGPGGRGKGKGKDDRYFGEKGDAAKAAKESRKKKLQALGEIPPPLLCTVDRRGKPFDPCAPCDPYCGARIC